MDDIQKKIDNRIRIKDQREDAKQRSINISWAVNNAVQMESVKEAVTGNDTEIEIEEWTDFFLELFDRKFMERTPQDTDESMTVKKRSDVAKETAETDTESLL